MATDPGFDGDESISSRSRNLTRRLHDLIGLLEEREAADKAVVSSDQVSDILDRFMLWCGNLGALHQPTKKISLDQRLSDAPEVRDQILINIADFNEAIEDRKFRHSSTVTRLTKAQYLVSYWETTRIAKYHLVMMAMTTKVTTIVGWVLMTEKDKTWVLATRRWTRPT